MHRWQEQNQKVRHCKLFAFASVLAFGCGSEDISSSLEPVVAPTQCSGQSQLVSSLDALVIDLESSGQNEYASDPSYINFQGTSSQARTECGTFVTLMLEHTCGFSSSTIKAWLGSTSPFAAGYHDAIVAQNGFSQLADIRTAMPGDVLAIRYFDTTDVTGHVGWVNGKPFVPMTSNAPFVSGTTQYEIPLVDSASSPHGPDDSRAIHPSSSGEEGIGTGNLRVYLDAAGQVVGYTWSNLSSSVFRSQSTRHLVIGHPQF